MNRISLASLQLTGLNKRESTDLVAVFNHADNDVFQTYAAYNFVNTVDIRVAMKMRFDAYMTNKAAELWKSVEVICDERNNTPDKVEENRLAIDVLITWRNGQHAQLHYTYHKSEYEEFVKNFSTNMLNDLDAIHAREGE